MSVDDRELVRRTPFEIFPRVIYITFKPKVNFTIANKERIFVELTNLINTPFRCIDCIYVAFLFNGDC